MTNVLLTERQAKAVEDFFDKLDLNSANVVIDETFHDSLLSPEMEGREASERLFILKQIKILLSELQPADLKRRELQKELECIN